jgi:hypothetical protein
MEKAHLGDQSVDERIKFKLIFKKQYMECGLDSSGSGYGLVTDACEHDNKISVSIKSRADDYSFSRRIMIHRASCLHFNFASFILRSTHNLQRLVRQKWLNALSLCLICHKINCKTMSRRYLALLADLERNAVMVTISTCVRRLLANSMPQWGGLCYYTPSMRHHAVIYLSNQTGTPRSAASPQRGVTLDTCRLSPRLKLSPRISHPLNKSVFYIFLTQWCTTAFPISVDIPFVNHLTICQISNI